MRAEDHPTVTGGAENANPGIEGITRWNASAGSPPWARGSLSGPITSRNSRNDPGQPWASSSGVASTSGERTCRKWICWPSISVVKWGSSLRAASWARQS